eukprot:CAMPEP_0204547552 /NCGR_PEP_ID=MMETSP0661-20131031/22883_1 /ASSEMBLY_ACC=CAM_ASM_000606 /TAXON_ID=109239 /ORGANISM="Alexandrium margalefi, Strain AMGDE01CS-322" /LENGTH=39 /DNA_ID= /DNA_START= /DNA_END= /DNA_ORIENTATION=
MSVSASSSFALTKAPGVRRSGCASDVSSFSLITATLPSP